MLNLPAIGVPLLGRDGDYGPRIRASLRTGGHSSPGSSLPESQDEKTDPRFLLRAQGSAIGYAIEYSPGHAASIR